VLQVIFSEPKYSGTLLLTLFILPSNEFYPTLEEIAGQGPLMILGRGKIVWVQRQGDGHYRMDFGWKGPVFSLGLAFHLRFGCHNRISKFSNIYNQGTRQELSMA
jgi:hypothetical protein